MSVYSCWLNVSGGLCNTNQEAAFGDKQNSLRNNSQSFPQNTWNMCFSEMLFISAKMDFFFFFFFWLFNKQITKTYLLSCFGKKTGVHKTLKDEMPVSRSIWCFQPETVLFSGFVPSSIGGTLLYWRLTLCSPDIHY